MAEVTPGEPPDGTVLSVGIKQHGEHVELTLQYRAGVIDADAAARIVDALASIAPDSKTERPVRVDGLAPPRQEPPDHRWPMARRVAVVSST